MAGNVTISNTIRNSMLSHWETTYLNVDGAAANPQLKIQDVSNNDLLIVDLHATDALGTIASGSAPFVRSTGDWDFSASPETGVNATADHGIIVNEDGTTIGTLGVATDGSEAITLGSLTIVAGTSVVFTEASAPTMTMPAGNE